MSVSSTTNRNDYTGTGTLDEYDYTFRIVDKSDLRVTVRNDLGEELPQLILDTDYSVDGVGEDGGGTVTLIAGNLPVDHHITIRRVVPLTQLTDIRNRGDFYPEVHEDAFDKGVVIAQQQQDEIDRSFKLPETVASSTFSTTLPSGIAGNPSRAFGTNPTGDGFALGPTFDEIANANNSALAALQAAADAAASADATALLATAAANSATAAANSASEAAGIANTVATEVSEELINAHAADTSTHGITSAIVGTSEAQTLSNKTFSDAPILTDIATPSAPPAGTRKMYTKSDGNLYLLDPAGVEKRAGGSGGGSKNYFALSNANGDFETGNISPWQRAKVTLTNGVPTALALNTGGFTLAVSSVTPLSEKFSMTAAKPASNSVGEGFISGPMTVDRSDMNGNVLTSTLNYEITVNPANVDMSGGATQSLEFWFYEAVSQKWYQPINYRGMDGSRKLTLSFQPDAVPANNVFHLVCFTAQTSALAYTVKFDDFTFGPQVANGGSSGEVVLKVQAPTSPMAVTAAQPIIFPSVKYDPKGIYNASTGEVKIPSSGTYQFNLSEVYHGATNEYYVIYKNGSSIGSQGWVGSNQIGGNFFSDKFIAGDIVTVRPGANLTIGYSAGNYRASWSVSLIGGGSSGGGSSGRVTAMQAIGIPAAFAANSPIIFPTIVSDSHGAYNASTGQYKVKENGYYRATAVLGIGNYPYYLYMSRNGATFVNPTTSFGPNLAYMNYSVNVSYTPVISGNAVLWFNAGDTLDIRTNVLDSSPNFSSLYIEKVGGSSQSAGIERSITAKYYAASSGTSNSSTPINFGTKVYDSNGLVTTGSGWKFIALEPGKYEGVVYFNSSTNPGVNNDMAVYKNGAILENFASLPQSMSYGSATFEIELLANDYFDIRSSNNYPYYGTASRSASPTMITIKRTGNY